MAENNTFTPRKSGSATKKVVVALQKSTGPLRVRPTKKNSLSVSTPCSSIRSLRPMVSRSPSYWRNSLNSASKRPSTMPT